MLVFVFGGLLLSLVLAGVVSNAASTSPDGLDAAARAGCTFDAEDTVTGGDCVAKQAREHDAPLAGYGVRGLGNEWLSTGLSGVAGVLVTFAVGGALFWVVRRTAPKNG